MIILKHQLLATGLLEGENGMLIMGIDPGTRNTGLCLINHDGDRSTIIKTQTVTTLKGLDLIKQICKIYDAVFYAVMEGSPELIGIEEFSYQGRTITDDAQNVNRVIGVLYLLSNFAPIMMLQAADWKLALSRGVPASSLGGSRSLDFAIRRGAELRTGYSFGNAKQHEIDAAGVALVAGDRAATLKRIVARVTSGR